MGKFSWSDAERPLDIGRPITIRTLSYTQPSGDQYPTEHPFVVEMFGSPLYSLIPWMCDVLNEAAGAKTTEPDEGVQR